MYATDRNTNANTNARDRNTNRTHAKPKQWICMNIHIYDTHKTNSACLYTYVYNIYTRDARNKQRACVYTYTYVYKHALFVLCVKFRCVLRKKKTKQENRRKMKITKQAEGGAVLLTVNDC